MCIGIQNGGFALKLGILAHVFEVQAITFSCPHQATALKLRQSSEEPRGVVEGDGGVAAGSRGSSQATVADDGRRLVATVEEDGRGDNGVGGGCGQHIFSPEMKKMAQMAGGTVAWQPARYGGQRAWRRETAWVAVGDASRGCGSGRRQRAATIGLGGGAGVGSLSPEMKKGRCLAAGDGEGRWHGGFGTGSGLMGTAVGVGGGTALHRRRRRRGHGGGGRR